VVLPLVDPVTPDELPVPAAPELVPPEDPLLLLSLLLPPLLPELLVPEPEVPLEPMLLLPEEPDGLDELLPVPPAGVPLPPCLLHAVRDRAATTASTAVAVLVRVVFIRNSLRDCRIRKVYKSPRAAAPG